MFTNGATQMTHTQKVTTRFPHIRELSSIKEAEQLMDYEREHKGRSIINNSLAVVTDLPVELFERPLHDQYNYHASHKTVRAVIMLQRLLGGVGFPGGKVEESDDSYLDTALREFHEETLFDIKPLINTKVFIEENVSLAFDSRTNVMSGLHIAEVENDTFMQIAKIIQARISEDQHAFLNKEHKIFGQEVTAIYPIFLTDFTLKNIDKQAAFDLVSYQLNILNQMQYAM